MEKQNIKIVSSKEIWSIRNQADINRVVLGFADGSMSVNPTDNDFLDAWFSKISGKSNLSEKYRYEAFSNVCDQIAAKSREKGSR